MRSKSCLLGMFFPVVAFMLITAFVIPSTFGQCPTDASGIWVYKFIGKERCCSDSAENGKHKMKDTIEVAQDGDEISASWVDDMDGSTLTLTGVVNAKSVYFKMESTDADNPECGEIHQAFGLIEGNEINGNFTEADTCGTKYLKL